MSARTVLYCPQCQVDVGEVVNHTRDDLPERAPQTCAFFPNCAVPGAAVGLPARAAADAAAWDQAASFHEARNEPRLRAQAEAAARALRKYAEIAAE